MPGSDEHWLGEAQGAVFDQVEDGEIKKCGKMNFYCNAQGLAWLMLFGDRHFMKKERLGKWHTMMN